MPIDWIDEMDAIETVRGKGLNRILKDPQRSLTLFQSQTQSSPYPDRPDICYNDQK